MENQNINEEMNSKEQKETKTKEQQDIQNEDHNQYSKGLRGVAFFLKIICGISVCVIAIALSVSISFHSDQADSLALSFFEWGIVTAFSSFVLAKLFNGISVISEAAEEYLYSKKNK